MKILGRSANPVRTAVREAVKQSSRRMPGLSNRMIGAAHTSGGVCLTRLVGGTTSVKWVMGDRLGDFRP